MILNGRGFFYFKSEKEEYACKISKDTYSQFPKWQNV